MKQMPNALSTPSNFKSQNAIIKIAVTLSKNQTL